MILRPSPFIFCADGPVVRILISIPQKVGAGRTALRHFRAPKASHCLPRGRKPELSCENLRDRVVHGDAAFSNRFCIHEHLRMAGEAPAKVQHESARMGHELRRPVHDLLQHRRSVADAWPGGGSAQSPPSIPIAQGGAGSYKRTG